MARIIYDEPENKKEYNKLRKNWNDTYNKKNEKYKGIKFDMDGVEYSPYQEREKQIYYEKEKKQKKKKEKGNGCIIALLIIIIILLLIPTILGLGFIAALGEIAQSMNV